ncbi:ImmA/IrrE family metallo-endopeptidase [Anaerofustis sp.]|uniref:ImmA/IrrE family metallo-endopeptidase n=1 Tax=Anaerofustis sp. TaxID=1872517 RepID=UPI0025B91F3C|nr:ImmA/IrrE family metallo-endopeptidase [Anaerofustis sp.]
MDYSIVYLNMPIKTKGFIKYNAVEDFYTIFINPKLNYEQQKETIKHEIEHIKNNDFDKIDVGAIEEENH